MKTKRNNKWQKGGVLTAIITPFIHEKRNRLNPAIDARRFEEQINRQIAAGIFGIVPVGTTGESPTLSPLEHLEVIGLSVRFAQGRIPVIAGVGSNSTKEAIELSEAAEDAGADALLHVAPYYNKPTQEGLYQHFAAVARNTSLPIMLYSIPGRCGVEIAVSTIARLRGAFPNIIALKEAGGKAERTVEVHCAVGDDFLVFSGDDNLTGEFLEYKAVGVVSVLSNLLPYTTIALLTEAKRAWKNRGPRSKWAQAVERRLNQFIPLLFEGGNPAGIKFAMQCAGFDSGVLRLPLVPPAKDTRVKIRREVPKLLALEDNLL